MKKKYLSPSVVVINMQTENLIASSPTIGQGTTEQDAAGALTHKKGSIWSEEEKEETGIWK